MSTLQALLKADITITETLSATDAPYLSIRNLTYAGFSKNLTFTSTSSPAITHKFAAELTGDYSLDLTNIFDPILGSADATGKKLIAILLNNLSTTADLTVAPGTTNGYPIDQIVVKAKRTTLIYYESTNAQVSSTQKIIQFSMTAGEKYQAILFLG